MQLPVVPSSSVVSEAGLLRLYDRALLHWLRHYGDENDVEVGVAIATPNLPRIAEANTLLGARAPAEVSAQAVIQQIDSAFSRVGATCARIVVNPDLSGSLSAEFNDLLLGRGYVRDNVHILTLGQLPAEKLGYEGLTIIPARASFRHVIELSGEMVGGDASQAAESLQLHLDDSHYDAVIALGEGNKAVAWAGVMAAGEVGLLRQLYVSPQYRRRGIGRVMLARAMDICERSAFRHVLAGVAAGNEALLQLLTRSGFHVIGQVTVFRRPDDVMGEL